MANNENINTPTDVEAVEESVIDGLAVVSDNTTYVHTFDEPFEWEGKTYKDLTFNFGNLRGRDVLAIMQELRMRGIVLAVKTFDVDYQYRYAARCCEQPIGADMLLALPVKDFDRICNAAQRFLVSTGR